MAISKKKKIKNKKYRIKNKNILYILYYIIFAKKKFFIKLCFIIEIF